MKGGGSCILDLFSLPIKVLEWILRPTGTRISPQTQHFAHRRRPGGRRPHKGARESGRKHHQHLALGTRPQVQLTPPLPGPGPTNPNTSAMFAAERRRSSDYRDGDSDNWNLDRLERGPKFWLGGSECGELTVKTSSSPSSPSFWSAVEEVVEPVVRKTAINPSSVDL